MDYEIVLTDNEPPEPRIIITKEKMTVFAKKDENTVSDFEALKDLSYKDGDNLTPEKLIADVVDMLGKYLSAQQSRAAAKPHTCPSCKGKGWLRGLGMMVKCRGCNGTGQV